MEEIEYLHRERGIIEKEKVYGERWLRLIYGHPLGNIFLWAGIKRAWFSTWYGIKMSQKESAKKIRPFIEKFELDENEFSTDPDSFKSFNDFFSRKLIDSARPIETDPEAAVFPADGRHLGFQKISAIDRVFVKGQTFNLPELFQSEELAEPYKNGSIVISRLCPVDYHRFHFPVAGKTSTSSLLNGSLFSVNPIALRKKISVFWQNKRFLSFIESKSFGTVAQFLVGATCVGTVTLTSKSSSRVEKGEEHGFFSFGGSCVITLFQNGQVELSEDLKNTSSKGMELYAKMGEEMGKSKNLVN